jgi:hypothetical protein
MDKSEIKTEADQSEAQSKPEAQTAEATRVEVVQTLERPTLEKLLSGIRKKEGDLRADQAEKTAYLFETLDTVPKDFSGEAFIESEGMKQSFKEGVGTDNLYNANAVRMRDGNLNALHGPRADFFKEISKAIPPKSRILHIGCGGDMVPEGVLTPQGHEVIHTDASKSVTDGLKWVVGERAFAADLIDLDHYLSEKSMDILVGNSVLGYVAPRKLKAVVGQIAKVMAHGGIFTFDMAPHDTYFRIAKQTTQETVINNSQPDPGELIRFIDRFGPNQGPSAYALHYSRMLQSVQVAILRLLEDCFGKLGFGAVSSKATMETPRGPMISWTLRVARDPVAHARLLQRTAAESDLPSEEEAGKIQCAMMHVDRGQGMEICKQLGIVTDWRKASWNAMQALMTDYFKRDLDPEIRKQVVAESSPDAIFEKIRAVAESGQDYPSSKLDEAVCHDQQLKSMFIQGALLNGASEEEAMEIIDQKIDEAYLELNRKLIPSPFRERLEQQEAAAKKEKREERRKERQKKREKKQKRKR